MSRALFCVFIVPGLFGVQKLCAAENSRAVSLVVDQSFDRAAQHGMAKLQSALRGKGWIAQSVVSLDGAAGEIVVVAGTVSGNGAAVRMLRETGGVVPSAVEALAVEKTSLSGIAMLIVCGADDRGLMYADVHTDDRRRWAT